MVSAGASIVVVDPKSVLDVGVATPLAQARSSACVRSVAETMLALASGEVRICLVDEGCSAAEAAAVAQAAWRRGVLSVYVCETRDADAYDRAMRAGFRRVTAVGELPDQAEELLQDAEALRRRHHLDHQEVLDLQGRFEALRQRCAQQAEQIQVSQETFFLDLSRVMTIISNIMDGIVFLDRDGNVTLLNPVAEDLLAVKAFAAVGKSLDGLTGQKELLEPLIKDYDRLAAQREVSQTIEVHHGEQDLLYIKCISSRVSDYRGQAAGAMIVLKDVTSDFKSDQLKNQYLSIVAHELRTPLTGIKTFSTMMAKGRLGDLNEKQQRVVDSIREQSLRLEHQIDKLINLGHLESDEYGQDREPLTVGDLAAGLVAPFDQPARDRQITIDFACEVDEQQVLFADRTDLRRAVQAIVENALKFTPDGGTVTVRIVQDRDAGPRLTVKDSGIGVDPRYQRRIFEKFFQVEDPLTRHHGGAGLGLFVAKEIVEAHGSRIEVSSQLGQGAEFSFMLPKQESAATRSEEPLAPVTT